MRRLISLPYRINNQIAFQSKFQNITFKQVYFSRSSKNLTPKNLETQKPKQNVAKDNKNDEPNQPNNNSEQQKPHIKLSGPKKLHSLLKSGNINIIPYYLKNTSKPTKNIALPFTVVQDKSEEMINNPLYADKEQKKDQNKQQLAQPKKSIKYPFVSSLQYRGRLMKKYNIVQSIKATRKINQLYTTQHILSDFRRFNFRPFAKDMNQRSYLIRLAFYTLFFASILFFSGPNVDKILPFPDIFIEKPDQFSESQIQSKLNQIKQITYRVGPRWTNQMTLVFNQQKQLSLYQRIQSLLGFKVNTNKSITFDTQNPNLIIDGLQKVQQNKDSSSWVKVKPEMKQYTFEDALFDTLFLSTPFIGIAITYLIFRKINPDSMIKGMTSNKKNMKIESTKDIKVRFKDVAGMDNAKKQITQFVDFLKKSDKYVQMGAKIPKGALLTGPPGTGKTMLAKACAGEAGTSFFYVSGSQFVQMFVGLGAARVRQLFAKARQQAPSIIFIDQIDAIGKKRQTSRNEQKDSTLNQMLVEMDGFSSSQTVIVLAATNRKDTLDSALTRPGRFDRMVEVTLPELKARQQIFMVHLAPLKINPERPLFEIAKRLAELTPGFSGADIANLCNEAAIIATRKKRTYIEDADFEQASQRIMAGYIKKGLSNQKTRKRVAYHEAGHAVCGWYLRGGDPLVKLTIIPRSKGALGYAQYLPKTAYIRTRTQLIDQIAIMLGGTTSQQMFLGNMSSGNSDDLQKVYSLARRMITQFGMGLKTYNMTLDEQRYVQRQSQNLCNTMDQQILQIVNEATNRAKRIMKQKRDIVEQLTQELLAKQTINSDDILRIMGARPAFN